MVEKSVAAAAAERVRQCFTDAESPPEGQRGVWYFYMSPRDVKVLVEYVLAPAETAAEEGVQDVPESRPEFEPVEAAFRDGVIAAGGYVTGCGQLLRNVHDPAACKGRACVIHAPSDHHMKEWPTNWRHGGMFDIKPPHMERVCPHGIGHPDPDDIVFHGPGVIDVHGCDGCCRPPEAK